MRAYFVWSVTTDLSATSSANCNGPGNEWDVHGHTYCTYMRTHTQLCRSLTSGHVRRQGLSSDKCNITMRFNRLAVITIGRHNKLDTVFSKISAAEQNILYIIIFFKSISSKKRISICFGYFPDIVVKYKIASR